MEGGGVVSGWLLDQKKVTATNKKNKKTKNKKNKKKPRTRNKTNTNNNKNALCAKNVQV